jgi:two-component system response regulator LytT
MPEVIFSDIELGDGLSFEIFRRIQVSAPVIFCTAFDEYAIRAFDSNSIDYLLKPIDEKMLEKSLDKYLRLKEHLSPDNEHLRNLDKAMDQMESAYKKTLLVSYREKIIPVKLGDVGFIYASNGITSLKLADQKSYVVSYTLEQLEAMLDPNQFFRANRQFIINRDFIENIEYYFNRKLVISCKVEPPEKIIVSRVKAAPFLNWMER